MSLKSQNIGILGSGAWGTALACILNKEKIKSFYGDMKNKCLNK